MTLGWSASIVIPAHNEAIALPRLLSALCGQDVGGRRLQVVVAVNGSTDATAAVAQGQVELFAAAGHQLIVAETAIASKAAALNLGDDLASAFPRLYLDADVALSPTAIRRTIEVLEASAEPRLAAPRIQVGECSSGAAAGYGRIWSQLPYVRSHVPGVGFYAVNRAGRERWWRFPIRVGADDKFVRLHFTEAEAVTIDDASFTVFLPENMPELIRVRARWNHLNRQIVRHCPGLLRQDGSRWFSSARHVIRNRSSWPDALAFITVWAAGWVYSSMPGRTMGKEWARAESSRARRPLADEQFATGPRSPAAEPIHERVDHRSVHVIVVMSGSVDTIANCLIGIIGSQGLADLRITVVDGPSGDGLSPVRSRFPAVEVVPGSRNVGRAAVVNRVVLSSTSRWIALIDPDVEVAPDTLAAALDHLSGHPAVGSCGVHSVDADGRADDRSYRMRPSIWSEIATATGLDRVAPWSRIFDPEHHHARRATPGALDVDAVSGSFHVIDRRLFVHLGGYDEHFACWWDLDLGIRALEAGAAPQVVTAAIVRPCRDASSSAVAQAAVDEFRGRAEFQARWWPAGRAAVARAARTCGLLGRRCLAHAVRSNSRAILDQVWSKRSEWSRVVDRYPEEATRADVLRPRRPADGDPRLIGGQPAMT